MVGSNRDKALGALLGLAVGDAVGTTLEFRRRDSYPPLMDMIGGGPFKLLPGQWTDDTSMALCLADSLIASGGEFDAADLMQRFVRWFRQGENSVTRECFDIGNQTRDALDRFKRTGQTAADLPDETMAAGNGTIMRLAPVAILAAPDAARAADLAAAQSRTTHPSDVAADACRLFAAMLVEAIGGAAKADVLRCRDWTGVREVARIADGSVWREMAREEVDSSGYVIATLSASLWCIERTSDFREAVLLAANLGDDADTVAAVTGQLAGALYGRSGIPEDWLGKLAWRDHIEERAARLLALNT